MSARPGRIKGIVEVPFERPRGLALKRDARFLAIEEKIWQMVEESPERIGMASEALPRTASLTTASSSPASRGKAAG
jgi:hypothetical protein